MKYHVTAEHTQGKSIGHPCSRGIFDDPANELDLEIEAGSEDDAIAQGQRWLETRIEEQGECNCRRKLSAGGDSWWDSVSIAATISGA
jgi:hypothetical protein